MLSSAEHHRTDSTVLLIRREISLARSYVWTSSPTPVPNYCIVLISPTPRTS